MPPFLGDNDQRTSAAFEFEFEVRSHSVGSLASPSDSRSVGGSGVKSGELSDPRGAESKLPSATCGSGSKFGNDTSLNPPAPAASASGWMGGDIDIARLLPLIEASVPKKGAPLMLLAIDGAGDAVFSGGKGTGGVGVRAGVGRALSIVDDRPDSNPFSRRFALELTLLIVLLLVNVGVVLALATRGRGLSRITVSSMPVGALTFLRADSC